MINSNIVLFRVSQMDIITALTNTILKARVTTHSQEAFYIALYLNNINVNYFIVYNTNILLSLINDVCKKYVAALDFCVDYYSANSNVNNSGIHSYNVSGNNGNSGAFGAVNSVSKAVVAKTPATGTYSPFRIYMYCMLLTCVAAII